MDTADTSLRLTRALTPSATPRAHRTLVRIAHGVFMAVALIATAGAIYEAMASRGDAAAYPPGGRLVDIGGYRLHLDCRGEGSPTVVMDAGLGGSSLDWSLVQPQLAATTRVCSYDRAGMGWSDPGPGARSPAQLAAELHTLLENAGIDGPYVLVGHSLAGKSLRLFARAHPSEVAGMVLVDARSEQIDAKLSATEIDGFKGMLSGQATLYAVARRLGVARLFGAALLGDTPLVSPALAQEMVLLDTAPDAVAATTAEGLARAIDDADLAGSTLGAMPLAVIATTESMEAIAGWSAAQQSLAELSSRGRLMIADSGHAAQLEQPGLVIEAVRSVLAEARRSN